MLLGLWFLVPLYLVVVNSFKTQSDVLLNPLSAPVGKFTLESYRAAFSSPSFNISRAYLYSAIITVSVVAIVLLTASSLSYVMARSSSRWARLAYLSILAGLMIPPQVVIIPAVKVLRDLGLIGTLPGLVLYDVATNLPIAVFVYYGFIQSIPRELDESASIDGAGPFKTFWLVIFPVIAPATASIAVILSVFVWNDFLNPLIILGPLGEPTVTTGAFRAAGLYSTDWSSVFAYVCLSSAPMLVLFLTFQRFIVSGLTAGAVKG
jgi:raffinose/stachyose/melibiose transport system permease protein